MDDILSAYYKSTLSAVNLQIHVKCFQIHDAMIISFFLVCGTRAKNLSAPFSYILNMFFSYRRYSASLADVNRFLFYLI
jgi:hypothetical protein